jgi:hypothetical protein
MDSRSICLALLLSFTQLLQAAVVRQYHHVSDETPASTSTSPERFAMHLDYLQQSGFEVVPLQDLAETLRAGKNLPDRTAAITFADDAVFRDEPMRFLVSEQSPEEVAKTKAQVAQLSESGELAEIIERMRLD